MTQKILPRNYLQESQQYTPFVRFKENVTHYIAKLIEVVKEAVLMPFRLIGSKSFSLPGVMLRLPTATLRHCFKMNTPGSTLWEDLFGGKGYTRFGYQTLFGDETKNYLIYACAAAAVQRNKPKWLESYGFTPISSSEVFGKASEQNIASHDSVNTESINEPAFFDPTTGLKIFIFEKGDELLLSFGAFGSHTTQFKESEKSKSACLGRSMLANAVGGLIMTCPSIFKKADEFVEKFKQSDKCRNKKLTLCGQSLGGALTSYVSLKQQIPGVALNALPIGPGLQQKIGTENLRKADEVLTHVISKGDIFANCSTVFAIIDLIINLLGLKTAGNFGKKIHVSSIYQKPLDTHYHILGSLFARWEPTATDLCKMIASPDKELSKKSIKQLVELMNKKIRLLA